MLSKPGNGKGGRSKAQWDKVEECSGSVSQATVPTVPTQEAFAVSYWRSSIGQERWNFSQCSAHSMQIEMRPHREWINDHLVFSSLKRSSTPTHHWAEGTVF